MGCVESALQCPDLRSSYHCAAPSFANFGIEKITAATGRSISPKTSDGEAFEWIIDDACTLVLLVSMLAGVATGLKQDFTLAPAHAHLNLVGGVPQASIEPFRCSPMFGGGARPRNRWRGVVRIRTFLEAGTGCGNRCACETAGLATYDRCDAVPSRHCIRGSRGHLVHLRASNRIVDRCRRDGAVCGHRVQGYPSLSGTRREGALLFASWSGHRRHFFNPSVA
jgi:hypothetical protein